ncbi:unnamed protein product [Paramecium sonneborni]|uniref:Transmembrane protein n=1 Tax=Paramecium sonneborni TaxID=65129 RepID=A0A8S1MIV7_9CILI|nr:unnamed protein product [Paramecium sonneborni]
MKIILTFVLVLGNNINWYQVQCSYYTDVTCQNSGYCYLNGTNCQPAQYHKVTDLEFAQKNCKVFYIKINYVRQIEIQIQDLEIYVLILCRKYYCVYPSDNIQESTFQRKLFMKVCNKQETMKQSHLLQVQQKKLIFTGFYGECLMHYTQNQDLNNH